MSFFNVSNHHSSKWSPAQRDAAAVLHNNILDLSFPNVPTDAGMTEIEALAAEIFDEIFAADAIPGVGGPTLEPDLTIAMVQGETALTFALIRLLLDARVRVVVATTERKVVETVSPSGETVKTATFAFAGFREVY